jgi:thiamine biosynthesis lipoprotein
VYTLSNSALCASASNRRAWGNGLHHVLDALTGEPTTRVIATWAVVAAAATSTSPPTMVADGLATGLFFREASAFATDFDFQYVRMLADGSVEHSSDIQGEMFT